MLKGSLRDTSKNKMVWYRIGTDETVQYSISTINGTALHYYHINFVVDSHILESGESLINYNFRVMRIVENTFNPFIPGDLLD